MQRGYTDPWVDGRKGGIVGGKGNDKGSYKTIKMEKGEKEIE